MASTFTDSAGHRVPCPLESYDCTSAGTVETTLADHLYSNHESGHLALMMAKLVADNRELRARLDAVLTLPQQETQPDETYPEHKANEAYNLALKHMREALSETKED